MNVKEELHRLIDDLPDNDLAAVRILLEYVRRGSLRPNEGNAPWPELEAEDGEWLDAGAEDVARRLEDLESDVPSEELAAWREACAKSARPARYVPGKGLVLEDGE